MAKKREMEAELRAQDNRRYESMLSADHSTLATILQDALVYVHSSGTVDDRESYLSAVRDGRIRYDRILRSDEQVELMGDLGLINGVIEIAARLDDELVTVKGRFLAVWVHGNLGWRLVRWHATRME